jgi:predicted nucleotidyltransferase
MSLIRRFRDRDYLETEEGFFFTVVGNIHPRDHVIAYLKNIPSKSGKWGRGGRRYKRALKYYTMDCLAETLSFLTEHQPQYIQRLEVEKITFSSVPLNCIRNHYRPEDKLRSLSKRQDLDELQLKTIALVNLLTATGKVPLSCLGVTGSILIGIHNPAFSDIDLTVYGQKNSLVVKETMKQLMNRKESPIQRLMNKQLKEWCKKKSELFPLTLEEVYKIYQRRWNRGTFQSTLFSIHPIKVEQENLKEYGDRTFTPLGIIEAKAQVINASEAFFMPGIYRVQDVQIRSGLKVQGIEEVITYEGLYRDLVYEGEYLLCRGKLEKVEDHRDNRFYYRIIIGSPEAAGYDYIKPVF